MGPTMGGEDVFGNNLSSFSAICRYILQIIEDKKIDPTF